MIAALNNPFFWFAAVLATWAMWRLLRWMSSGGRLPLRGRRGTASAFGAAGLAMQALYNPGAKHALEARQEEESLREDDDEGDPPDRGRPGT
jgi:hypothetical protein